MARPNSDLTQKRSTTYIISLFCPLVVYISKKQFWSNKIRTQIGCSVFACPMEAGHFPRSRAVMLAGLKVLAKYSYFTNLSLN